MTSPKHRTNASFALELVKNTDTLKTVKVTGFEFTYTAFKAEGGRWVSNGVIMPDGKVAGAVGVGPTQEGRDDWREIFDTLGVRSVGQALGREMRDLIDPPTTGTGGKPNTSALRVMFEATVDAQIKRGRLAPELREEEIDFLVAEEVERRNAISAAKRAEAEKVINAPGALKGVSAGNGGTAR